LPRDKISPLGTSLRWFTQSTNAFSEKVENHCQALAMYFVLTTSVALTRHPAIAAGIVETIDAKGV
jgi:hypothetical protein